MLVNLVKVNDVNKISEAMDKLEKSIESIKNKEQADVCSRYIKLIFDQINNLSGHDEVTVKNLENRLLSLATELSVKKIKLV